MSMTSLLLYVTITYYKKYTLLCSILGRPVTSTKLVFTGVLAFVVNNGYSFILF